MDLLLNTTLPTDDQIPVEIKAESFQNRMDPFVNGVRDDFNKLNYERNTDFSESTCIIMAVPFNRNSLNAVVQLQYDRHRIFRTVFTGEVAIAIAVYTEADGWLPSGT